MRLSVEIQEELIRRKELVDSIFGEIEKSPNAADVDRLFKSQNLSREIDRIKYPHLRFNILRAEISQLREDGIISKDNKLSEQLSNGSIEFNALSRLLYALAWKNGDLGKIKHIIDGIEGSDTTNSETGFVFRQFGRFLEKKEEPIVDQHVIRAFIVRCKKKDDIQGIDNALKIEYLKNENCVDIANYRSWIKKICKYKSINDKIELKEAVDDVLFSLGKMLKREIKEES